MEKTRKRRGLVDLHAHGPALPSDECAACLDRDLDLLLDHLRLGSDRLDELDGSLLELALSVRLELLPSDKHPASRESA